MALDQKAGTVRRSVSALRNFQPETPIEMEAPKASAPVQTPSFDSPSFSRRAEAVEMVTSPQASSTPAGASAVATTSQKIEARLRKLSFNSTFEMEARFKKARLKGGFNTLEDAHNEALKIFCELVEAGKLDRF